jgi:hypothetical protein
VFVRAPKQSPSLIELGSERGATTWSSLRTNVVGKKLDIEIEVEISSFIHSLWIGRVALNISGLLHIDSLIHR